MRLFGTMLATAVLATVLAPTGASADPDELMPCKLIIVKAPPAAGGNGLTKFVCKPPTGGSFNLPSAAAGGNFALFDVNVVPPGTTGPFLVVGGCVGLGNPAGLKGYKCSDGGLARVILFKEKVVKAVVKSDWPAFSHSTSHPYASDVAIKLTSVGASDQKRYCARFGGPPPIKNDASQYKAKDAPAPSACSPSGAFLDEEAGF